MENISPSPTSRISPLTPGEDKNSDSERSRKAGKPQPAAQKTPATPAVADRDDQHELDERA
jgi:hypothetical protein